MPHRLPASLLSIALAVGQIDVDPARRLGAARRDGRARRVHLHVVSGCPEPNVGILLTATLQGKILQTELD